MKKTRIVSFVLALVMLCGTAVLFCSCGGTQDGPVTLSGDVVDVDLTGYTVVFAQEFYDTSGMVHLVEKLADRISAQTGTKISAAGENKVKSESDKEILVGATTRAASKKVQNGIKGEGFAIELREEKIVIAGTSNMHLVMAMEYFAQKYLQKSTSSTVSLYESACAQKMKSVVLAQTDVSGASFVCAADVVTKKQAGSVYAGGGTDVPGFLANEIIEQVARLTGLKKKDYFPLTTEQSEPAATEFIVGQTDRALSRACLAELSPTAYGFFVREGQFVLTAYNEGALLESRSVMQDLFEDATVQIDEKNAKIVFPEGFFLVDEAQAKWVTDFPKPEGEGIHLINTQDDANNSLQYYYTGAGVSAESYRAYCKTLTEAGYTVLTQNEIEQSLYTTLVDPTESFSLYVAYNAYAHKEEFQYDDKYNAQYEKCFRVVSSPLDSVTLPDEGLLTPNPDYVRKTASAITAMEINGEAVGMGYVITLEDGRLVIFDGGGVNSQQGTEHEDLWRILSKTNERITGTPTSASNPVRIAAWVITHSHWDHYQAFLSLLDKYGSTGALRIHYLLGNFPSKSAIYRVAEDGILLMGKDGYLQNRANKVMDGFQIVKVHAGQKFYLANLEIEVLTTFEDLNPARIYTQNDTNTVLRFTMHTTNEQGVRVGEPVTSLWLGDSNALQSRYMCAMFGDYLKSDMVQLAHHGNVGCEKDLYTCVSAKVLWFPMDYWRFELFTFSGKHPTIQAVNRHALSLPSMQYVYVSANPGEIGNDYNICLPFSAETGQPDYDAIYEAVSGEPLSYDNVSAFNSTEKFK